jgi:hypothetical protein
MRDEEAGPVKLHTQTSLQMKLIRWVTNTWKQDLKIEQGHSYI